MHSANYEDYFPVELRNVFKEILNGMFGNVKEF